MSAYPHHYLTAACAVGLSVAELDEFLLRLDKALKKAKAERAAAAPSVAGPQGGVAAARASNGPAGTEASQRDAEAIDKQIEAEENVPANPRASRAKGADSRGVEKNLDGGTPDANGECEDWDGVD